MIDTRPVVLCVVSLQFVRDVEILNKRGTKYRYVHILDYALTAPQMEWVPKHLQVQGEYVNDESDDAKAVWQISKEFGKHVINSHRKAGLNVVAVMAGNWDYWNEECMRLACEEMGIPFLVLMREHDLTGIRRQNAEISWMKMKRIPTVTAVACAGPATSDLIKSLGIFPANLLRDTGWPRHDVWRYPSKPMEQRPPVVFMSYWKGYNASSHFENEMLPLVSELSSQFPEVPMFVKGKHRGEVESVQAIINQRNLNVRVMDTPNLTGLIQNARCIVGFHSAIMYECLLAPVPILLPCWGETNQKPEVLAPNPLDPLLRGHMTAMTSREDLLEGILKTIASEPSGELDMDERREVFRQYFIYTEDKTNVERTEDFIAEFALAP